MQTAQDSAMLEALGLSPTEAAVYMALLSGGSLSAQEVADEVGLARTSVYAALRSLQDQAFVESGVEYGAKFRARHPEEALTGLVHRERHALEQREQIAQDLVARLAEAVRPSDDPEHVAEVLRDPRVVMDRWRRMQAEAEREIDVFVKAPILSPNKQNPTQKDSLLKGIRHRVIYELPVLDDPIVAAHLTDWRSGLEEARVYPGLLPTKLAIFDSQRVMMPLEVSPRGNRALTLVLSSTAVATTLKLLFEDFWEASEAP